MSSSSQYYDFFDEHSAKGRVFDQDVSAEKNHPKKLAKKEIDARTEWNRNFDSTQEHYFNARPDAPVAPRVCSWNILLGQRLMPPRLVLTGQRARSQTAEPRRRCYPPNISSWVGFADAVNGFCPIGNDKTLEKPYKFDIFRKSKDNGDEAKRNEAAEQTS
jgi:hypothetical protein